MKFFVPTRGQLRSSFKIHARSQQPHSQYGAVLDRFLILFSLHFGVPSANLSEIAQLVLSVFRNYILRGHHALSARLLAVSLGVQVRSQVTIQVLLERLKIMNSMYVQ